MKTIRYNVGVQEVVRLFILGIITALIGVAMFLFCTNFSIVPSAFC